MTLDGTLYKIPNDFDYHDFFESFSELDFQLEALPDIFHKVASFKNLSGRAIKLEKVIWFTLYFKVSHDATTTQRDSNQKVISVASSYHSMEKLKLKFKTSRNDTTLQWPFNQDLISIVP